MSFINQNINKMKRIFFAAIAFSMLALAACSKDEKTVTVDSSQPEGTFTAGRTGSFTAQNGTPTMGTAELGTDSKGVPFLRFGSNFTTQLATGTVTVYLSTSASFVANPGAGNPDLRLVGTVGKNGEMYFKLTNAVPSNFTHVILWCGSANIPFGNARLQ
jgi:hypothetical protein